MDRDMARMTTAEAQGCLAELAERLHATSERLARTEGGETVAVLPQQRCWLTTERKCRPAR